MYHFFVAPEQIGEKEIWIEGSDVNHIRNVLRMTPGEKITVSSGADGKEYFCEIRRLLEDQVVAEILEQKEASSELPSKLALFQGLPKSDKMELIIQKCVELGVERIVAVSTARAIVKLDKKESKKLERWQKIAEAAAKQSGRGRIPTIGERVLHFREAVAEAKALDGAIIPYEKEEKTGLRKFVQSFSGESVGVFIGPEGGFTEEEIAWAQENGVTPITLGKRILRTETAGMTTTAILLYELE